MYVTPLRHGRMHMWLNLDYQVLKTQELMYLELLCVLLANHDQNSLFSFVQTCSKLCLLCKVGFELMQNCQCILAWFDRSKLTLDQSKFGQNAFFCKPPTQPQLIKMFRVLCFCPRYIRQTLATFQILLILRFV